MNRRDLFKIPILAILPKAEKEKKNKFVYRYYVPYYEGRRLWYYAIYIEGDEKIKIRGQFINGDEKFWKVEYEKNFLFYLERDFINRKCEKQIVKEGDWIFINFDCKSQIG